MKKLILMALLVMQSICFGVDLPVVPREVIYSHYRVSAVKYNEKTPRGTAIGFSKRYLLTAAHVLKEDKKVLVEIFDADGVFKKQIEAKVEKIDMMKDMGILKVEEDLPYAITIDSTKDLSTISIGDWMYMIGGRMGWCPYDTSFGMLSAKVFNDKVTINVWQGSMLAVGGNSGGGVYDAKDNKFIGLVVMGGATSLFVPLTEIKEFCKNYLK